MAPNNLQDAPEWAVEFMKAVPTNWDETCFIDGYPGRYVIMARRAGNQWYVVGINAQEQSVTTKLDLNPFFAKGANVITYTDDAQLNGKAQPSVFKSKDIAVTIPQNGAFVVTSVND